jgi:hypothetical protein
MRKKAIHPNHQTKNHHINVLSKIISKALAHRFIFSSQLLVKANQWNLKN